LENGCSHNSRTTFTDPYDYPAGKKARLEPLGVIVFSAIMGTSILQLISQAGEELYSGFVDGKVEANTLPSTDIAIILFVILAKFILLIFCTMVGGRNPSVGALASDHRNDICTNSFALISAYLGAHLAWWCDSLGAAIIGVYILIFWACSGYANIRLLAGYRISRTFHKQLIYLAWNHDERIRKIDTVRAFHFGSDYIVEIDVVLPSDMILHHSHDIGESLQMKLESIPGIDRAYVHLDYEYSHKPEHKIAENLEFKSE